MKTISVSVSEGDYEAFRWAARAQGRPIAQLIREAMALYRVQQIPNRTPLAGLPVLPGHRPTGELPSRAEIYDEVYAADQPAEDPDE